MFIIFTDNITHMFIRSICVYSERNCPIRIIQESLCSNHMLDITESHYQLVIKDYFSTLSNSIRFYQSVQ